MGNNKKPQNKSRRWFISGGLLEPGQKKEKVKMLTAEGRLIEVDKSIVDAVSTKLKATNQEIFHWMKNPSKKTDS